MQCVYKKVLDGYPACHIQSDTQSDTQIKAMSTEDSAATFQEYTTEPATPEDQHSVMPTTSELGTPLTWAPKKKAEGGTPEEGEAGEETSKETGEEEQNKAEARQTWRRKLLYEESQEESVNTNGEEALNNSDAPMDDDKENKKNEKAACYEV